MEHSFLKFVWRYSKREQIFILALTALSFPLVYFSLEIPKIIVNKAINGREFPKVVLGFEFEQIPFLLLMCFAFLGMVVLINGIKWVLNVSVGMTGERMLRRLRFMLFEQVMRFRIARFRTTKPGEVIQSMLGEIEPLGGFIGEVISTPAFQGGLLAVYVVFIFMQDVVLGLAAISLYPLQAYLIPKLQARVVQLNKQRARNTRVLADTISESVANITDIHTNDTARWHMAQISGRLHQNTLIRIELFRRKFTIKFVNNFLNQLTPFFFYSAGGYLVIKGDLDFGSLVAVLAAYKDLAAPWKAVLNYIQRWNDFNSRYEYVVETFVAEDDFDRARIFATDGAPLEGELELSSIEGGPGTGGLAVSRLVVRPGQKLAVIGGEDGAREALLRMMAGLVDPAVGRVTFGGKSLTDCTMPEIGASIAYVGTEPGMIARSIRDNLVYGLLRKAPDLAEQSTAEAVTLLSEARRTGNITADPEGDWIDYQAAGTAGAAELDRRLLDLVDLVGLADDLVANALNSHIDPADAERWTAPILSARAELRATVTAAELNDIAEPWMPGTFNTNGTLLGNALFGLPVVSADGRGYARMPHLREVLAEAEVLDELERIGWEIAEEFATLVDAVDEKSAVLDSFAGYPKAEILAAAELVDAHPGKPIVSLPAEARETVLGFALSFVQTRDRLDVLDEARIERLMEGQARARAIITGRHDFVAFDQDHFNPGRTVAENILNAKRRFDRKSAWRTLDEKMEAAIRAAGLRGDLIRIGLAAQVGTGGSNLSATSRRRVALARALLKRPRLLILDGVAGSDSAMDVGLRKAIRAQLPEAAIVYAAGAPGAAAGADAVIRIAADGSVRIDTFDAGPAEAGEEPGDELGDESGDDRKEGHA